MRTPSRTIPIYRTIVSWCRSLKVAIRIPCFRIELFRHHLQGKRARRAHNHVLAPRHRVALFAGAAWAGKDTSTRP